LLSLCLLLREIFLSKLVSGKLFTGDLYSDELNQTINARENMAFSNLTNIIAVEISIIAISAAVWMYLFYRKKKKRWQESYRKTKNKLKTLAELNRRYSVIKTNLHKILKERDSLKEALNNTENTPELKENIIVLNRILKQQSAELAHVKSKLDKKVDSAEALASKSAKEQLLEDEQNLSIADKLSEVESYSAKNDEEFNRLRTMNREQKGLISDLKGQLANLPTEDNLQIGQNIVPRLEQMLKESETCICMLEDELSVVISELNNKSLLVAQLEKSLASTNNQALDEAPDNEARNAAQVNIDEIKQLKAQLDDAMSMTMTMMTANGDQSNIISFARSSIACVSLDSLADAVLQVVTGYGLDGSIQLRSRNAIISKSTSEHVSERNMILLDDDLGGERYEQKGKRLSIRFDNMSLVLHGMPEKDSDTSSRYKDSLAVVMELANDHMDSLEDEKALQQQEAVLKKVIGTTQKTIQKVDQKLKFQAKQSKLIINSMTDVLGNPTFVKEMNESFQPVYKGIITETRERFDKLHADSDLVDQSFAKIIAQLSERL